VISVNQLMQTSQDHHNYQVNSQKTIIRRQLFFYLTGFWKCLCKPTTNAGAVKVLHIVLESQTLRQHRRGLTCMGSSCINCRTVVH